MLCKQRVQNCSITSHQLSSHTTDRMCIQLINSFMHCLPRMLGIVQAAQHRKSLSNKCWINGSEMKYSIRNIPSCLLLRNKWISNMLSTASQSAIHYENACGMRRRQLWICIMQMKYLFINMSTNNTEMYMENNYIFHFTVGFTLALTMMLKCGRRGCYDYPGNLRFQSLPKRV